MEKEGTINWADKLPKEPPESLWDYKPLKEALSREAIVFKSGWVFNPLEERRVQMAECHCTACGETYYLDYIRGATCSGMDKRGIRLPDGNVFYSREKCSCPECGERAEVLHTSEFGSSATHCLAYTHSMTYHQVEGHFAICTWYITYWTDKYGQTFRKALPYEAYLVVGRKMIMAVGYKKNYFSTTQLYHWEQRARCEDKWRANEKLPIPPFSKKLLLGTEIENSKLDLYLKKHPDGYPVSYLQVYLKHRNVENLMTRGLDKLVNELIRDCAGHGSYYHAWGVNKDLKDIDWKKARPAEMLHMTGQELQTFIEMGQKAEDLGKWIYCKAKGISIHIKALESIRRFSLWDLDCIFEYSTELMKVVRYLERQRRKYPKDHVGAVAWRDYIQTSKRLGEECDYFPQRLQTAHDQAAKTFELQKSAIKKKKMKERFGVLMAYAYESDGLLIRPAKTVTEFRTEGATLQHCVAGYSENHANGGTAIFFIRKAEAPEVPFYTLELDEKNLTVRQNRGLRNCDRTPEVKMFEEKWLNHLKELKKKEKKGRGKSKQHGAAAGAA